MPAIDLTGKIFGRLLVMRRVANHMSPLGKSIPNGCASVNAETMSKS